MKRSELISKVSSQTDYKEEQVGLVIRCFLDDVVEALKDGEKVQLFDFGVFDVGVRKERNGRNPRTGEKVFVPSSRYVRFKASENLKDFLNE